MNSHLRNARPTRRRVSQSCLAMLLAASWGYASDAGAANHAVSLQASNFNCSAVNAGDTVTLASGTRGPLKISDCTGSSASRIKIINDASGNGPVVIRRATGGSGGFVFICENCVNVDIDGSAKWRGAPSGTTYGIKVTMTGGSGPSAFLKVSGLSRFVTIRNIEVDGAWPALADNGIGISINDHDRKRADYPGVWSEGVLVENNYIHNVEGEGLYVGPNWREGDDIPVRDAELRYNLIEDTGWDGINLKSSIAGNNRIHHNIVRRAGSRPDVTDGQHHGITIFEGTGSIYNNWIERPGFAGIQHHLSNLPATYGTQNCEIFNNVIVDPGQATASKGIGIVSSSRKGSATPQPRIYSNTVIGASAEGIRVGSSATGGFIRDNIVAGSTGTAIQAPGIVAQTNNRAGNVVQMGFINAAALDFRLRTDSPARDAGSSQFPPTDYLGVLRPLNGVADQGAFEFDANGGANANARPNPPVLAVE